MTESIELRSRRTNVTAGGWSASAQVRAERGNGGVVVVANREPYSHERDAEGRMRIERPASGLVSGIEPIVRESGGTWIAHASGSADREFCDARGRVAVPAEDPKYTLQRIFLPQDEFDGFYRGFANEALWPLCHVAYTRPMFRSADWRAYEAVNRRFADAAVRCSSNETLLLVQDYHFALVPALVRRRSPGTVTSLFWHIPWPNYEIFSICPWKEEILRGMLGGDVLGFHTKQHCTNFLEASAEILQCEVNFEEMSISYRGHKSLVRAYPISVEWPFAAASREEGRALRARLGIAAGAHVSLGVDRADYTKGLLERVAAIETLLDRNESLRGKFVFVQIASPTRTGIGAYDDLSQRLVREVARVNARFATASWTPIVLELRTVAQEEVRIYYAMADSAVVTPLHDGMNLVAKEYAASCSDSNGVLVLSAFAGAAKELDGALVVNPYDIDETANAIFRAVIMDESERVTRMSAMRAQIASHSIADWSAAILREMRDIRRKRVTFGPARFEGSTASARTEAIAG